MIDEKHKEHLLNLPDKELFVEIIIKLDQIKDVLEGERNRG